MKISKSIATVVSAVCGIALLASACGTASIEAESATNTDNSPAAGTATATATTPSSIEELLGIPISPDEQDAYFAATEREMQERVAACMVGKGFEYTPTVNNELLSSSINESDRVFAETYGFGIASNPWEEAFEASAQKQDPNEAYAASLQPSEQDAYFDALNGSITDFDVDANFDDWKPGGCYGEALDVTSNQDQVFDEFANAFAELDEAIDSDPRLVEASVTWSNCMREAGFRFKDQAAARAEIQQRYDAILFDPDAFAEMSFDDDEASFVIGPQSLTPEAQTKVDELGQDERAIAIASWDCGHELRELESEVRADHEQRFIAEHGDAISSALNG